MSGPTAPEVYTVDEFCRAFRIGKTSLYELWKEEGKGPRYFQVGNRRLISAKAAGDWILALEAETARRSA